MAEMRQLFQNVQPSCKAKTVSSSLKKGRLSQKPYSAYENNEA